jgi:hypothetical protein
MYYRHNTPTSSPRTRGPIIPGETVIDDLPNQLLHSDAMSGIALTLGLPAFAGTTLWLALGVK